MFGHLQTFRISSIILLLVGLVWIFISRTNPSAVAADLSTAAQKGFLVPDFETQTLSGETIRLSDLHGKAVILNLWASWCPPCREEMPVLEKIYSEYRQQGLVVLGMHMTAQDSREAAADFVAEYGFNFPVPLDPSGDISRLFRVQALPTTYFIGADGIIADIIIGGPVSEAVLRAQAEALLKRMP